MPNHNHWNDNGDLIVEEKTLFRQVGWLGHSGTFYPFYLNGLPSSDAEPGGISPVFQQIAKWRDGGWDD